MADTLEQEQAVPERADHAGASAVPAARHDRKPRHVGRWAPVVGMIGLIVVLGLYTYSRDSSFGSSFTLNFVLVQTMPLALAAMGQTSALMVRAFDISVGALMSVCLVLTSFLVTPESGWPEIAFGVVVVLCVALAVGAVHVGLIRGFGLPSIIVTLATMSVLEGVALLLRPQPAGPVSPKFVDLLLTSVGFVPVAFIAIVVIAILADIWLYRSAGGLAARAAGLDPESALRRGVRVSYLFTRAFFIVSVAAAMGAFFLSAFYQIGDPTGGSSFTLTCIAAAVLGGASIFGGRGSFIGAVVGALFLTTIITVLPYLGWTIARGQIMIGVFTLLALSFYQAPELMARIRLSIANARITRAKTTSGDP